MAPKKPDKTSDSPTKKLVRGPLPYVILSMAVLWILVSFGIRGPAPQKVDMTQFQDAVASGGVKDAKFNVGAQTITGTLSNGDTYVVAYLAESGDELEKTLADAGVTYSVNPETSSFWAALFINLIPVLLIVGVFIWIMNQGNAGGGGRVMQFGKSRHKTVNKDTPKTTFEDVAGVEEAKEELMEVKEYLENPAKFQAMGAKIPRGVLLVGPPGTGKTLLARAVAGEAGVPFFTISGSDFVEMFVGVGAARVRDLFEQAKTAAPAIVFIDEIDAVGRHRGAGLGGGHDEREQTLNQLLVEMDGFDQRSTVIIMAATNRPDILDPALLRPGRFDRQVIIDRPDLEGRKGILRVHAKGKPLDPTVDLDIIAKRTPGFTGADLANVINEGALLTARRGKAMITADELGEAIDRVMAGPERKSRVMSERERRMVAYHEAGHALVAYVLPNTDPVHKITVIPRGRALGYTLTLPEEDKFLMTREELTDELAMLLGGRVAEEIVVGDMTTGAQNDIERATKVARAMVTEYGMSDRIGPMTLGAKQHEIFLGRDFSANADYSPQMAYDIDSEIIRLIDQAHDEALEILNEHRAKLDNIAEVLLDQETIDKEELVKMLEGVEKRPQRDPNRGAGMAVARRSLETRRQDSGRSQPGVVD
jgi:cell division protease FtsH